MPDNRTDPVHGWRTRGYLPHVDRPGLVQFVTFRLLDSVPRQYLELLRTKVLLSSETGLKRKMQATVNQCLDTGYGSCLLADPRVAKLTQEALLHYDGSLCRMHAWIIMPNHVHCVVETTEGVALGTLVKSWKTYVAHEANRALGRRGAFWHREYYDRYLRNKEHYGRVLDYIHLNPVKAGLCAKPEDWAWSSIHRHKAEYRSD